MQFIRRRLFLAIVLTMSIGFSYGQQGQTDSLTLVVTAMAGSNIYEASYVAGYAGTVSKQYQRFVQIMNLASDQQLLTLAGQYTNAVVRLYAWQALNSRKVTIPEKLRSQFHEDKTIVKVLKGCIADEKPVNALYEQDLKSPLDLSK